MHVHRLTFLLCCALLVACGGDKAGTPGATGEGGLPKPATASGSVTGMPDPGVAGTRPAASVVQPEDAAELPAPPEDGAIPPVDPAPQPTSIEGAPVEVPESTLPEAPNAPPPPPMQEAASATDPNAPRQ